MKSIVITRYNYLFCTPWSRGLLELTATVRRKSQKFSHLSHLALSAFNVAGWKDGWMALTRRDLWNTVKPKGFLEVFRNHRQSKVWIDNTVVDNCAVCNVCWRCGRMDNTPTSPAVVGAYDHYGPVQRVRTVMLFVKLTDRKFVTVLLSFVPIRLPQRSSCRG